MEINYCAHFQLESSQSIRHYYNTCNLFFPQIKVYSEFGGKPQTWKETQLGIITFDNNSGVDEYKCTDEMFLMKFIFPMTSHTFVKLSWAEYVFVSLSLALVIAKFFPAVHNQIVSRATRLEHQSLYWGTAVISNFFTYGLCFAVARVWSVYFQTTYIDYCSFKAHFIIVPVVQEVIIHMILLAGTVATLIDHDKNDIPIPKGIVRGMINISFCWSCFCCCFCCSPRCRVKALRAMVMFSFMVFIHRNIMDVISVAFMTFIEQSRALIVTYALLYMSSMFFLVLSISFIIFIMFHVSNAGISIFKRFFTFVGGLCMVLSVFGAIALTFVVCMIIFLSLNLKGVSGIVTGLIPSIALSAASWYIKKRLLERALKKSNTPDQHQPECGATNNDNNDGEVEGDQRLLLP